MEETKKWWQSKTVWAGVIAVAIAAWNTAAANFPLPAIPEFVYAILGFLGVYGRTTADKAIA